jgi:DNA-binding NarL/FixJ family response regulator
VLRRASARAVLVDHWPLIRLGLARVLATIDIRIVGESELGLEGVRMLRTEEADLMILGDSLGIDAVEATRGAKALPHSPRVLAIVGLTSREALTALLAAGVDGLLVRTAGPEDLAAAVEQVLGGERWVSPALLSALAGMLEPSPHRPDLDTALTAKEREVLGWLADGRTNAEIASQLFVAPSTVKTHLAHIYAKLGAKNRQGAVSRAVELGLLG